MEKKLEVKNLQISFKTSAGKVQAVRKISFDLYKGETLAIVGESGSGKSVTSKAIMGILAGNSIVEDGEILYDGQDLLQIDEEDFHKLRGNKISMIFQDPMSSLNPIVKIGKQLTEAMILKGRSRQKESKLLFNSKLGLLEKNLIEIAANEQERAQASKLCKDFDKFESEHIINENIYNISIDACNTLIDEIPNILFEIEKKQLKDGKRRLKEVVKYAKTACSEYVVKARQAELETACQTILDNYKACVKSENFELVVPCLNQIQEIVKEAIGYTKPNFFAMGYYLTFINKELPSVESIEQLNELMENEFNSKYLIEFTSKASLAIKHSYEKYAVNKQHAIDELKKALPVFMKEELDKAEVQAVSRVIIDAVQNAINKLELTKDSKEYTFAGSYKSLVDRYFGGQTKNIKEEKRFEKESAKIQKIIDSGKTPEWKPVPPSIVDFELTKKSIIHLIESLIEDFCNDINSLVDVDYEKLTQEFIEFLKTNASGVVNKVTKQMAKIRAIKVMEEVGIPEARKRFYQYPFEFSGGMRQRIVIAIALVSNPDILICDEPTTALDVTIQANILELINKLKRERNLSIIFITHDLGVVANMADHVAVMYAGKIVEYGTSEDIFYEPAHPYTWALLSSIPDLNTNDKKLEAIPGTPPNMIYPPVGDAFAERNKYAMQIDFEEQPPMFEINEHHFAATWLLHPNAPKVEPPLAVIKRAQKIKALREGGAQDGE